MAETTAPQGPDLSQGVLLADVPETGVLAGRVGDQSVLVSRVDGKLHAVSGSCTHYGGPLAEGLAVGRTVRCPWHHACFDLATGEALAAPAFSRLDRWKVETSGDRLFVREKLTDTPRKPSLPWRWNRPDKIVIVGGGAAGFAAAERLRRLGYEGRLTMFSADADAPYDRPNLSKDYLAGTAPEEWIPLRDDAFYRDNAVDLRLGAEVVELSPGKRRLKDAKGEHHAYDALLLATGAEPVRLPLPGFDAPNVFTLRSLADSRAIIAAAAPGARVAVIGASFIGLEVAASLRARGLEVHVVAPDEVPMQKVLGREVGEFVRTLHEAEGVVFHLGRGVEAFAGGILKLTGGEQLAADFVVLGVGVRPRVKLAEQAGLKVENGVLVDEAFRTSAAGVWAAGDIASYPEPVSGGRARVEHWVAAERQGQVAAASMLGLDAPAAGPPFFWSHHYGLEIRYVGYAPGWDAAEVEGSLAAHDALIRYRKDGRVLAVATLGRDRASLAQAAAWEGCAVPA
ncbi:FAD-dependent oxidoreductase [Caulobacter sp. 17J65-9]|uniref:FAD-dependent oxidoreductase n=1 Tax=Caulobacter sp. 17J65-9 TaxID=2709382 RepID=UPI0013C68043|nr:FAD-dependent oxidoreductase [Caulobacter sp. 17J65-9]NEX93469.1 FAD-dependent oxidoreductase [Caulobacter sp. 17J65-9]